jgi:hypothetical protein
MKAVLVPKLPFQERLEIGDTVGNGSGITISRATIVSMKVLISWLRISTSVRVVSLPPSVCHERNELVQPIEMRGVGR